MDGSWWVVPNVQEPLAAHLVDLPDVRVSVGTQVGAVPDRLAADAEPAEAADLGQVRRRRGLE